MSVFLDLADSASAKAVVREFFRSGHPPRHDAASLQPRELCGYDGALAALSGLRDIRERFILRPERFLEADDEVLVLETAYENPSEAFEAVGLRE